MDTSRQVSIIIAKSDADATWLNNEPKRVTVFSKTDISMNSRISGRFKMAYRSPFQIQVIMTPQISVVQKAWF